MYKFRLTDSPIQTNATNFYKIGAGKQALVVLTFYTRVMNSFLICLFENFVFISSFAGYEVSKKLMENLKKGEDLTMQVIIE